jgi:hypothetical protein
VGLRSLDLRLGHSEWPKAEGGDEPDDDTTADQDPDVDEGDPDEGGECDWIRYQTRLVCQALLPRDYRWKGPPSVEEQVEDWKNNVLEADVISERRLNALVGGPRVSGTDEDDDDEDDEDDDHNHDDGDGSD